LEKLYVERRATPEQQNAQDNELVMGVLSIKTGDCSTGQGLPLQVLRIDQVGPQFRNQLAKRTTRVQLVQLDTAGQQLNPLCEGINDFNGHGVVQDGAIATLGQKRTFYDATQFKVREGACNHWRYPPEALPVTT
jgi:hypothetical protein